MGRRRRAAGAWQVIPRQNRVFLGVGLLAVATWLFAAFSREGISGTIHQTIFIALFWGTMFGHTTLAAAWSAFGPSALFVRLPLSLAWTLALPVAIAINLALNGGPIAFAIPIGVCLLGQWFVLQLLLWGLAIGLGLRLQHRDDLGQPSHELLQFTLRQLIAVTAGVGLILGLGRLLFPAIASEGGDFLIFALLAGAEIVLTLPLVLAGLLRRFVIPGLLLAIALIATATVWELPLLKVLDSTTSVSSGVLVAINVGTALVTLVLLAIVRLNGYSLSVSRTGRPTSA